MENSLPEQVLFMFTNEVILDIKQKGFTAWEIANEIAGYFNDENRTPMQNIKTFNITELPEGKAITAITFIGPEYREINPNIGLTLGKNV